MAHVFNDVSTSLHFTYPYADPLDKLSKARTLRFAWGEETNYVQHHPRLTRLPERPDGLRVQPGANKNCPGTARPRSDVAPPGACSRSLNGSVSRGKQDKTRRNAVSSQVSSLQATSAFIHVTVMAKTPRNKQKPPTNRTIGS